MEDRRQSGIPRLSKLPLPRPQSIRATASRESLNGSVGVGAGAGGGEGRRTTTGGGIGGGNGGTELRNPRLRPAASRDRLSTSTATSTTTATKTPLARKSELSIETSTRRTPSQPSPRTRLASSGQTAAAVNTPSKIAPRPLTKRSSLASLSQRTPSDVSLGGKPRPLARRASQQVLATAAPAAAPTTGTARRNDIASPVDTESPIEEARPQTSSTDDSLPPTDMARPKPFKPRPSLSERTMETLSKLPSSPAVKGRPSASSFYDPDAPRRPPSRPGSQGSRPGSRPSSSHYSDGRPPSRLSISRPSSSSGPDGSNPVNFRASTNTFRVPLPPIDGTPVRNRPSRTLKTPSTRATPAVQTTRSVSSKIQSPSVFGLSQSRTPSPDKRVAESTASKYGSKTMTARPVKGRPSLNGLFKKPSLQALNRPGTSDVPRKTSLASQRSSTASGEDTNLSSASTTSTRPTVDSAESPPMSTSRKSSAALREQIAKAREAKRVASRKISESQAADAPDQEVPVIPTDTTFDFGLSDDPFNLRRDDGSTSKILQSRVGSARTTGRLNIAAMSLREIPPEVLNMYDLESIGKHDGAWAESVDLTRFVAADNELEMIAETVFPDVDPQDMADDADSKGSIFGGLETLDLHGNVLISLPPGLRRLVCLTSLNLSSNRLANNCLEVVSQIPSLRDLKLGGNLLYGPLDPCFAKLENLEILDLHGNNLTGLPQSLQNLSKLRILNISENSFESLPFEMLSKLPLTELVARKNKLSGVLIDDSVDSLPNMQILDVSSNQLTHLVSPTEGRSITMPALTQLCLSMNRLQSLPDISSWSQLLTLTADENSINSFPDGFTSLEALRSVDFSSNDIRIVPAEIARMDSLAMLRLSSNPLRDKKFVSMDTDELKASLAARLEPAPSFVEAEIETSAPIMADELVAETILGATSAPAANTEVPSTAAQDYQDQDSRSDMDDFATPPTSAPGSPVRSRAQTLTGQTWPVKPGGVLDRSNTQSASLHPVICSKLAAEQTVREIQLHHNLFTALPDSLTFFAGSLASLSLSHNQLVGESYLGGGEDLDLPVLKELNLASNHITSITPLIDHLRAPKLQKLDVSFNRIASLPTRPQVREAFPDLEVLLVSNNHLADLDPESIKGLRIVDADNNDIAHLNPRIGLLGGSGGLERLQVMGNRFRVPRWNVLERGTEATLRWLRGRVPVAEMGAWKEDEGDGDGDTSLADLD